MVHVMIPSPGEHGEDLSIQAAPKFCRLLYGRKSPLIAAAAAVTENEGSLDFDKTVNCIIGWASEASVQLSDQAGRGVTKLVLCRLRHFCTQRKNEFGGVTQHTVAGIAQ
jgi:hypothetical protein